MNDGRPRPREAGFVLPAVLVILFTLALIGGGMAILTSTEVRVAGLSVFSHRAAAAAGAGLEHAVVHFAAQGPEAGWPVTGTVDGYDYEVMIEADSFDFGTGWSAVSWSADRGINGLGEGQPVWVLRSTAASGPFRAVEILRLTTHALEIRTYAAMASGGQFTLRGNVTVSGVNVDATGQPVDPGNASVTGVCQENKAAVVAPDEDSVDATGGVALEGNPVYANEDPPYVITDSPGWLTPEDVLGLPAGWLDSYQRTPLEFAVDPVDPLEGIVYLTGDYGAAVGSQPKLDGSGILVIHNPLFHPREHDPGDAQFDPVKAGDPRYAPATLGNVTGGTYRGLVIADRIDRMAGTTTILGGLVTLSRTHESSLSGGARIQYSCQAMQVAAQTVKQPKRLAWVSP